MIVPTNSLIEYSLESLINININDILTKLKAEIVQHLDRKTLKN